ncbi:MAG: molybdopterin oxidoreductase family protein [Microthrixaceae bacterium]
MRVGTSTSPAAVTSTRRCGACRPEAPTTTRASRGAGSEGTFWPCPDEHHPGTPQLYTERFAHPDGRARFSAIEHVPPPVRVDDEYPLILTTGRLLAQYLSGNQTKRIPALQGKAPGPYVELHPATAHSLALAAEDRVELTSRQGQSTVPWRPNDDLRTDTVFMPYHWRECNVLVASDLDPVSRIPGFKYTPIHVARVAEVESTEQEPGVGVAEVLVPLQPAASGAAS